MSTAMELKALSREELIREFLTLNEAYLILCRQATGGPRGTSWNNMRLRLREILDEMRRRREPLQE